MFFQVIVQNIVIVCILYNNPDEHLIPNNNKFNVTMFHG